MTPHKKSQGKKPKKHGPSTYQKRLERSKALHPNASLSQLRGHPKKNEKPLSIQKRQPDHALSWNSLSPRKLELRDKGLKVISKMRREGVSLAQASREYGTSPEAVIRNTNALKKMEGRWTPKSSDRISRVMKVCENGKEHSIEIKDSRYASTIGKYHSAIGQFLHAGDETVLKQFVGKRIKDANGNWHVLETDPNKLNEIREVREDEEFYIIYG
jgi:lambda repressor-like predicted transcriptional regulator